MKPHATRIRRRSDRSLLALASALGLGGLLLLGAPPVAAQETEAAGTLALPHDVESAPGASPPGSIRELDEEEPLLRSPWLETRGGGLMPLTLKDAVRSALANSFDLQIASADRRLRRRRLGVERGIYSPTFRAASEYSEDRQPTASVLDIGATALGGVSVNPFDTFTNSLSLSGLIPLGTTYRFRAEHHELDTPRSFGIIYGINPIDYFSVGVELTQPLLRGLGPGYNNARIRIAANDRDMADHELRAVASELLFDVDSAYWRLAAGLGEFRAKARFFGTALENLANLVAEQEAGRRSEADLVAARAQLALRRVELREARTRLEDARDRLALVINRTGPASLKERWEAGERASPYSAVLLVPISLPESGPFEARRDEALEHAFARRGDYLHLLLQVENRGIDVDLAGHEKLPELNLKGGWEQLGLDDSHRGSFSSLGSGDFYQWSVGIEFSYDLFDSSRKSRWLEARDRLQRGQLESKRLENRIVMEIDASIRNLESLRRRMGDLEERVRLHRDLLEKEREKLALGRAVYFDVTLIENELIESETLLLRARFQYETEKANFHLVTGTILERHDVVTTAD